MYKGDFVFNKFFCILGTFVLICFSFYYTDYAINIIRKTDPIMKEIISYSELHGNTSLDAVLVNGNLIPGISGNVINLDESYNNMKRLGKFDESLLVFEEVLPETSISNNYDFYIVSGNTLINNVSLIFILDNTSYVEELLRILNTKNVTATFFVTNDIFDNSLDLIKLIINNNHRVELYDNNYDSHVVKKYNSLLKMVSNDNLSFCYSELKNDSLLNNCKEEKLYTIIPSIVSSKFLYNDIKNNLNNGMIISLKNNLNVIRELPSTINYIFQKGKKIVSLDNLIKE